MTSEGWNNGYFDIETGNTFYDVLNEHFKTKVRQRAEEVLEGKKIFTNNNVGRTTYVLENEYTQHPDVPEGWSDKTVVFLGDNPTPHYLSHLVEVLWVQVQDSIIREAPYDICLWFKRFGDEHDHQLIITTEREVRYNLWAPPRQADRFMLPADMMTPTLYVSSYRRHNTGSKHHGWKITLIAKGTAKTLLRQGTATDAVRVLNKLMERGVIADGLPLDMMQEMTLSDKGRFKGVTNTPYAEWRIAVIKRKKKATV
jgi:hypothetical protein